MEFDALVREHERVISESLKMQRVKDKFFSDYWGEVKSLGAWGGDFVLVTSRKVMMKPVNISKKKGLIFSFLTKK